MTTIDEAIQEAIEEKVSKRFRNLFARISDMEKGIRETNSRITQIKCRLGQMNAPLEPGKVTWITPPCPYCKPGQEILSNANFCYKCGRSLS